MTRKSQFLSQNEGVSVAVLWSCQRGVITICKDDENSELQIPYSCIKMKIAPEVHSRAME